MSCDLAAKLTSDGTASACHQDGLSAKILKDFLHIDLDRFSAQQILHCHILHLVHGNLSVYKLVHTRQDFHLAAGFLADIQDIPAFLCAGTGNGQEDLVDLIFFGIDENIIPASHDRNSFYVTPPFVGVVVDDAAHLCFCLIGTHHIPQDHLSGCTGADEHYPVHHPFAFTFFPAASLQKDEAVGETDSHNKHKLDDDSEYVIGRRHPANSQRHPGNLEHKSDGRRDYRTHQFTVACKPPHAVIQAQYPEHQNAEYCVPWSKFQIRREIFLWNPGICTVKAKPECQKIGCVYCDDVVNDQVQCNDLPMLKTSARTIFRSGGIRLVSGFFLWLLLKILWHR